MSVATLIPYKVQIKFSVSRRTVQNAEESQWLLLFKLSSSFSFMIYPTTTQWYLTSESTAVGLISLREEFDTNTAKWIFGQKLEFVNNSPKKRKTLQSVSKETVTFEVFQFESFYANKGRQILSKSMSLGGKNEADLEVYWSSERGNERKGSCDTGDAEWNWVILVITPLNYSVFSTACGEMYLAFWKPPV